ncbi:MAG: hypothetical protein QME90_15350 [Thermodesulfobacteriota bacterium]|nr:hypothetical protein [Thermodesulfobacteriota bacterium]
MVKEEENDDLWRNRYEAFVRLYRGRGDIIAEQKEDGPYIPIEGEGFTFERFLDHIHLRKTYAIYHMDDLKRVHFGLFDADVFPRNQEWPRLLSGIEEKRKETLRIMETLLDMGLKRKHLLLEFPTVGFHLLIFFKDPVEAKRLKGLMQTVLDRCHLSQLPFYPKKVEENRWGDRIQLPLRINRNTFRRSNFIRDLESFDPEHYDPNPDFSVLDEVDPINREWMDQWVHKE